MSSPTIDEDDYADLERADESEALEPVAFEPPTYERIAPLVCDAAGHLAPIMDELMLYSYGPDGRNAVSAKLATMDADALLKWALSSDATCVGTFFNRASPYGKEIYRLNRSYKKRGPCCIELLLKEASDFHGAHSESQREAVFDLKTALDNVCDKRDRAARKGAGHG